MNVKELIKGLEKYEDKNVSFDFLNYQPDKLTSWRGSYDQLCIEPIEWDGEFKKVSDLIKELWECVGKEFEGYKGGHFIMGEHTEVWVDKYGEYSRTSIVNIEILDGDVVLITKRV